MGAPHRSDKQAAIISAPRRNLKEADQPTSREDGPAPGPATGGRGRAEKQKRANRKPALTKARFSAATARAIETEAWRERKRRHRKKARDRCLRFFTVCGRWRRDRKIPDLRLTGRWLEAAGFPLGQEIEVEVEAGRLTLRAI
jgi:hypothetical protein